MQCKIVDPTQAALNEPMPFIVPQRFTCDAQIVAHSS
jgi:hypothetical protein